QYPRYAFVARAMWGVFAGVGAAVAMLAANRVLAARNARLPSGALPWPQWIASALAAPFVAALFAAPHLLWSSPVGVTHELRGTPHAADEADLRAALERERERYARESVEQGVQAVQAGTPAPIRVAF